MTLGTRSHRRNEVGAVGCCQQRPAQRSSLFAALTAEWSWRLCRYRARRRRGCCLLQMAGKSGGKLSGVVGDAGTGAFWTKSKGEEVNFHC